MKIKDRTIDLPDGWHLIPGFVIKPDDGSSGFMDRTNYNYYVKIKDKRFFHFEGWEKGISNPEIKEAETSIYLREATEEAFEDFFNTYSMKTFDEYYPVEVVKLPSRWVIE